ncbi:MAG: hypothetical protein MI923_01935 [Phycisphaerales bacterium]|nr:hypothetical protein [Phycisphaerales bacterium]
MGKCCRSENGSAVKTPVPWCSDEIPLLTELPTGRWHKTIRAAPGTDAALIGLFCNGSNISPGVNAGVNIKVNHDRLFPDGHY